MGTAVAAAAAASALGTAAKAVLVWVSREWCGCDVVVLVPAQRPSASPAGRRRAPRE